MNKVELALHLILLGLLAGSVFSDVTRRTIPNMVCLGVFLLGLAHAVLFARPDWIYSLVGSVLVFLGGLGLHKKNVLGGGDIKLIAALAVWLTPIELARFILSIMLAGGFVGAWYLLIGFFRRLKDKQAPAAAGVPYALAIVGGFLVMRPDVLLQSLF